MQELTGFQDIRKTKVIRYIHFFAHLHPSLLSAQNFFASAARGSRRKTKAGVSIHRFVCTVVFLACSWLSCVNSSLICASAIASGRLSCKSSSASEACSAMARGTISSCKMLHTAYTIMHDAQPGEAHDYWLVNELKGTAENSYGSLEKLHLSPSAAEVWFTFTIFYISIDPHRGAVAGRSRKVSPRL